MTRKDYILIAGALCATKPTAGASIAGDLSHDLAMAHQHAATSHRIADALARDNSRFNRALFLAACGVQS